MSSSADRRLAVLRGHLAQSSLSHEEASASIPRASSSSLFELILSPEVSAALQEGRGIVALESTIISHGMPYPKNFETALQVEETVRKYGATPATIAILAGKIHVGLTRDQLQHLAQLGLKCAKVSRRDMAHVIASKADGATTVSGTMMIAHMAGIKVFVTGGIGGVHRDGEKTMDISADLTELGRTPVAVVCAGAKSILDIPRTLEYLETQGVAVVGYGTSEFPAFFVPTSGCKTSCRLDTPDQCAQLIDAGHKLGISTGQLFTVPIPADKAADGALVEKAIQQALKEADQTGIHGNAVTPFLLKRINELTHGKSLQSNIALVLNNASVGAQIAVSLSKLSKSAVCSSSSSSSSSSPSSAVIIGGAVVDMIGAPLPDQPFHLSSSNPGVVTFSVGGVGRNIAEVMSRLNSNPLLLTCIGNDSNGKYLISSMESSGMQTSGVAMIDGQRTAVFNAILSPNGDLLAAIADMSVHEFISPQFVQSFESSISSSKMLVLDGNVPIASIRQACHIAVRASVPIWFEPTSVAKATRIVESGCLSHISFCSPNLEELDAMVSAAGFRSDSDSSAVQQRLSKIQYLLEKGVKCVIHTMGENGVILASRDEAIIPSSPSAYSALHSSLLLGIRPLVSASFTRLGSSSSNSRMVHIRPFPIQRVKNTTGAGDNLSGGCIAALLSGKEYSVLESVLRGMAGSRLCLEVDSIVSPKLSIASIQDIVEKGTQ